MDNTLLITLSAQNALMRKMEVAANNMANISTIGFKAEQVLFQPYEVKPASIIENPRTVDFVRDYSIARDFRVGSLQKTDNPLDIAISGDGFLNVQTPNGNFYTRDGRMTLNAEGVLISHDGNPILDESGQNITIDNKLGEPSISKDGNISQNGKSIAKLGVFTFEKPGALDKIGDNLYKNTNNQAATLSTNAQITQGMLEGSNVVAVEQLTNIMEISRAFESATRIQKQAEELRSKAIERLARVQA